MADAAPHLYAVPDGTLPPDDAELDPRQLVAHLGDVLDTTSTFPDWLRALKGQLTGGDLLDLHTDLVQTRGFLDEAIVLVEAMVNQWIWDNGDKDGRGVPVAAVEGRGRYRATVRGGADGATSLKKPAKQAIAREAFERLAPWLIERTGHDDSPEEETARFVRVLLSNAMDQLLEAFTFEPSSTVLARGLKGDVDDGGVPWAIQVSRYRTPVEARTVARPSFDPAEDVTI